MVTATRLVNDYGVTSEKLWATLPTCCNFNLLPLLRIHHYVIYFQNTVYFLTSGFGGNSILAKR